VAVAPAAWLVAAAADTPSTYVNNGAAIAQWKATRSPNLKKLGGGAWLVREDESGIVSFPVK